MAITEELARRQLFGNNENIRYQFPESYYKTQEVGAKIKQFIMDQAKSESHKKVIDTIMNFMIPDPYNPISYVVPTLYAGPKALGFPQATGKFSNLADKMARFEINDKTMKFKLEKLPKSTYTYSLDDLIDHPTLFDNYPELLQVSVTLNDPGIGRGGAKFATSKLGTNYINLGRTGKKNIRSTLIHEIQHYIQNKEGFAEGAKFEKYPVAKSYDYYRSAGEIEARDVEARLGLTAKERETNFPYISQGVNLLNWLVNKK